MRDLLCSVLGITVGIVLIDLVSKGLASLRSDPAGVRRDDT